METKNWVYLLSAKEAQNAKLTEELRSQRLLIEKLQVQIENLLRILYGKKSEKKKSEARPESDQASDKTKIQFKKDDNSSNVERGRKKLPENLERQIIKYELPESERICYLCGNLCHCIGKEISEQLEFIPAKLFVKEHRRYKYGCRHGCVVKIAPLSAQPISKGIPGPGWLIL